MDAGGGICTSQLDGAIFALEVSVWVEGWVTPPLILPIRVFIIIVVLATPAFLRKENKNRGAHDKWVKDGYPYLFARQVVEGMDFLEMKRVCHRDLATRNILLLKHTHIKVRSNKTPPARPSTTCTLDAAS